jgi:hypothetical protein
MLAPSAPIEFCESLPLVVMCCRGGDFGDFGDLGDFGDFGDLGEQVKMQTTVKIFSDTEKHKIDNDRTRGNDWSHVKRSYSGPRVFLEYSRGF